jgi:GTP pyrophosphokinase
VEGAMRKLRGHLIEGKLEESDSDSLQGYFTVELEDGEDFSQVFKNLRTLPSILKIRDVS